MKKLMLIFALALTVLAANANPFINEDPVKPNPAVEIILKTPLNPFCKAIVLGDVKTVKRMIVLGEDINQKCLGKTPLMYAARFNKAEILSILLENGAKTKTKSDQLKFTAKRFAELSNATDALEILKAK
ncbi:Ankyrin repeat-containing protein [Pustulibacterium marinum]|uniref:Ankyrin repeat-containing protein n=1 Tax=Pustulibacterium marinum TaxID=1224947 RepID=A0A1I7EUQ4_9FLAO|nr:ankyrin repeat domain-containing protein [Pustulibacterium marinum]SFU27651.1 Ankyrin repeat-containing protein [Pustulibacterium marinum]